MLTRTYPDNQVFQKRREKLYKAYSSESALILFSSREGYISRFRAKSSFVYLSGFEEPDSWLVIRLGKEPTYSLFVPPKDPNVEIWDGERYGPELCKKEFQPDFCFPNDRLSSELPGLLKGVEKIYYDLGEDSENDRIILDVRKKIQMLERRSGKALCSIGDTKSIMAPMRVKKDQWEITWMKESCELSAQAHMQVMKYTRPGVNERELMGHFLKEIYAHGAQQEGYSSIVASGDNATTLHYRANNRKMLAGDLLLIDAGAEKNYYTADITRTYPVSGKFTGANRDIYEAVLEVQKKLIERVRVGFSLPELHDLSCRYLCEQMVHLGLLKGTIDELVAQKKYVSFYPHGIGHYLGMDVHDIGLSREGDKPVPFEAAMTITMEPGIYIPRFCESVDPKWRGLGVRIEDDILVTEGEPVVMSVTAPKEIKDLESIVGTAYSY
jgi:Xaa-Pro aminopeptidase